MIKPFWLTVTEFTLYWLFMSWYYALDQSKGALLQGYGYHASLANNNYYYVCSAIPRILIDFTRRKIKQLLILFMWVKGDKCQSLFNCLCTKRRIRCKVGFYARKSSSSKKRHSRLAQTRNAKVQYKKKQIHFISSKKAYRVYKSYNVILLIASRGQH